MNKTKFVTKQVDITGSSTATFSVDSETPVGYTHLTGVYLHVTQAVAAAGAIDTGLVSLKADRDQVLDDFPALGIYASNDVAPSQKAFMLPDAQPQNGKVTNTLAYRNLVAHGSTFTLTVTFQYEAR